MKTFKNFREGSDIQEEPMDGVAKGSLPDDQHMCATKIFKEGLGEGTPIIGEHALPDENGNVAWYKVMFEHGVDLVTVGEEGVAVLGESKHTNHMKKMKEEVEEEYTHDDFKKDRIAKVKSTGASGKVISRYRHDDGEIHYTLDHGGNKTSKHPASNLAVHKEEVEEIEEVSKKTLGSYIKKATVSYGSRERMGKEFERDAKETRSATDKNTNSSLADTFQKGAVKRRAGIMKATDKLVNKKN